MKFRLVDRIDILETRERIVCVKAVSMAEEYLGDHFPTFPVLPGVLMLQAMVEAGTWLLREALNFEPTVVLLRSVKNVTYKSFVKPGQVLTIDVSCRETTAGASEFAGRGQTGDVEVVRARFSLSHFSLAQRDSKLSSIDDRIRALARREFQLLRGRYSAA